MKLPAGYVPGLGVRKATAKGGLGERLLKSMGWREGKGLGRQEDGISSAIVVKKKDDAAGVGANAAKAVQWENRWWEAAFDSAAAKLQQDAESSDSSESDDSTAALPAAKRQRLHRDGTASTATEAEAAIAAALAKDRWGRFGGRDGKMARIRAQERLASAAAAAAAADAAATTSAAGHAQPPTSAAAGADAHANDAAGRSAEQSAPESNPQPASAAKDRRRSAGKKAKQGAAEGGQIPVASASASHAAAYQPRKRRKDKEPAADLAAAAPDSNHSTSEQASAVQPWWGASRFVSSGCLTGLQRDEAAPAAQTRVAFSESTQEALYMAVHGAKTAGKKGLGRGIGSGVIAGAKWVGRRTVFEDAAGAATTDAVVQMSAEAAQDAAGHSARPAVDAAAGTLPKDSAKIAKQQKKKKRQAAESG